MKTLVEIQRQISNIFAEQYIKAAELKDDEMFHLCIGVNDKLEVVAKNTHHNDEMLIAIFSNEPFKKELHELYKTLNSQEQKAFLTRQEYYVQQDDYIYYNVDSLLYDYCKNMFEASFKLFVKKIAIKRYEELKKSKAYQDFEMKIANKIRIQTCEDVRFLRVKAEAQDLKVKIDKLDKFIAGDEYKKLNTTQRMLLPAQSSYMKKYLQCLELRLANWFDVANENTCVSCGESIPEGKQVCDKCMEVKKK